MIFNKKDSLTEEFLAELLDFFSGVFFGVSILGALIGFFILKLIYSFIFALLIGIGIFCVFLFFGLVAKSLSILMKKLHKTP